MKQSCTKAAATLCAILVLATGGCDAFDPCPETEGTEDAGQLDGTWDLQTINGNPIPAGGYNPVPLLNDYYLLGGELIFETHDAHKGVTCADLVTTRGMVLANYRFRNAGNNTVDFDWEIGSFFRDHFDGTTMLHGGGKSLGVTIAPKAPAGGRTLTGSVRVRKFGLELSFTLVFRER
jgi:hypothetical protein